MAGSGTGGVGPTPSRAQNPYGDATVTVYDADGAVLATFAPPSLPANGAAGGTGGSGAAH
jgi:hypothetical protein